MKSFRLYKRYGAGVGAGCAGAGCAAKDVSTAYISTRPLTCVAGCHGTRTICNAVGCVFIANVSKYVKFYTPRLLNNYSK